MGVGFWVLGLGLKVLGFGFRVHNVEFRVQGDGVQGSGCKVFGCREAPSLTVASEAAAEPFTVITSAFPGAGFGVWGLRFTV